ncbi:hypothetical protein ASE73_01555 [Sphingomonas sp. Leaf24]|uniref:DUF4345 domain-containing protein n=1 Tax=unclassified Sphingomonas TaxID=196159 RepID=UPI0006F3DEF1|nr:MULTISPECIES: DUF4345 domain-containing protein [unclassified Sphingomonas]KQM22945.1 hypothetical protein ASE50_01555 [Sphingomonas sp. Leaf5]KQM76796.1 hypothetical protein ASE70_08525 [Sphingomonas sp. Leaf22]KQM95803.1 hypothetical protein ASE73_01555 [Sphingomonas sp. Leaf24]
MTPRGERTLLQVAVAIACFVPLSVATFSILRGAAWLQPAPAVDLDSHFRYLSGIFLVLGLAFASCIPAIEGKTGRFRLLGAMVVGGGLARLLSLLTIGAPSTGHVVGLGIELAVVPLLLLWQTRIAHRYRQATTA